MINSFVNQHVSSQGIDQAAGQIWGQAPGRFLALSMLMLMLTAVAAYSPANAQVSNLPDFTGLVDEVAPSVVNIETLTFGTRQRSRQRQGGQQQQQQPSPDELPDFFRRFFDPRGDGGQPGQSGQPDRRSGGSGFIISEDGFIVTNHHVIDGADEILVRLEDRQEYQAELIGSDEASDIAVLKIEAEGRLPALGFGDSETLRRGEWVIAIGSPFSFEQTVTAGIVSGKGRSNGAQQYVPFIQTDVAINRGNSGGPLLNMEGDVVGINSWILSSSGGYIGLSFSIPSDVAQNAISQLREKGFVSRGLLGVGIEEVSREKAEAVGLDRPRGALVNRVEEGGAADKAGIEVGDVIVEFDGRPISLFSDLPPLVGVTPPGSKAKVRLFRWGDEKTVTATITELSEDALASLDSGDEGEERSNQLGLAVDSIDEELRDRLGAPEDGVVITEVESDAAYRAGVRRGDVILMINNEAVGGIRDFRKIVEDLEPGKSVVMLVFRDDNTTFRAYTPETDE